MERSRKRKILIMLILSVTIAGLSIGFAAFSGVLNISSSANVSVNSDTFSVKFSTSKDSLIVNEVEPSYMSPGISANAGVIDNSINPVLTNLSTTFTEPGQYVEYTFYARNEGEYTAYLNSINYYGEKKCESDEVSSYVQSACDSINLVVYVENIEYTDTSEISGHYLEKKTGEEIKIRLDYPSDGTWADAPFKVTFPDVMMIYSTIDGSSYMPSGGTNVLETLNSKIKTDTLFKGTDASVDFSLIPETGVYVRSDTENQDNPIYYYRGAVTNNNVLFANKCWLIVRTTETDGTKIIYNGSPTSDNKCNGDNASIGKSVYNDSSKNEEDFSYIYGDGTNSTIKNIVDTWYTANMTNYTSLLEDTVWCNDRTFSFYGYANGLRLGGNIYAAYVRNADNYAPSLYCPSEYSLTVSSTLISNKLTYPVGLLTADEFTLSGMGWTGYSSDAYLNINESVWTMTPCYYTTGTAGVLYARGTVSLDGHGIGSLGGGAVYNNWVVRPSISLKPGTLVTDGDGTVDNPYVVAE